MPQWGEGDVAKSVDSESKVVHVHLLRMRGHRSKSHLGGCATRTTPHSDTATQTPAPLMYQSVCTINVAQHMLPSNVHVHCGRTMCGTREARGEGHEGERNEKDAPCGGVHDANTVKTARRIERDSTEVTRDEPNHGGGETE